ncbi:hypothetical protein [Microbispora sp. H13382]|uniref:hypothetical protein n=1 Tax=Microbispora sp. H13382 TaxID=2729112 RepID=UPI001600B974|nr:hypothetical protein [Microbispora sp. H13382]
MLAAAAGAYDKKDGAHSDVAARFAFAIMTGTPGFRFAPPTRVHLAEVAGAYATEMTEGETVREHVHVLETALDRACAQFGGEPVWVGPAARAFAEELNGRRARLKSAVQHVIAELEAKLRATPAKVSRSAAMSG